ncbi:M67 family metallopeptidase [uncultured Parasphingopyxis sp.]|uniref:M67 family metallopeptidase n=1 Tax=uncultured Parasphingopyxis sp. TaxID=1547918 RepID=UPI002613C436|nr:M67 family metallopeptidase [uncultured Parasphingopyxis sp.]
MKLNIARSAHDRVLEHCAATPTVEACGLLIGRSGHVERAVPTPNRARNPAIAFEIDPSALFAAIRDERAGKYRVLGHFHSHPCGEAQPSDRDREMALDVGRYWIIVASGRMAAWQVVAPGQFAAVELCLASDGSEGQ